MINWDCSFWDWQKIQTVLVVVWRLKIVPCRTWENNNLEPRNFGAKSCTTSCFGVDSWIYLSLLTVFKAWRGPIVGRITLNLSYMLTMFLEWRWIVWDNPVRVIKKFVSDIGVVVSSGNINIRFRFRRTINLLPLGSRLELANENPQV